MKVILVVFLFLVISGCASPGKNIANKELGNCAENAACVQATILVAPGADIGITGGDQSAEADGKLDLVYQQLLEKAADVMSEIVASSKPTISTKPTPDEKEEGKEEETEEEKEEVGTLTRFQEYREGSVYAGSSILMTCPNDFIYKSCSLNGKKMSEGTDTGRQFFHIKEVTSPADISCELKTGGTVSARLKFGDDGSCGSGGANP